MIERKTGDLFAEDVEALVNSVNCVGVMGRGIALQFKNVFPCQFQGIPRCLQTHEVHPGRMFVFETRQLAGFALYRKFPDQAPLAR